MYIHNPASGEIIATIAEDNRGAILDKYRAAKAAISKWLKLSIADRLDCINRFDELLHEEIDELSDILTSEVGKPIRQSKSEILGGSKRLKYFIENSEKWLCEEVVFDDNHLQEKITYEPLGIIANISAWNYPYLVGINVFIPALIAGNAVLYKASEFSTLTGVKIEELMHRSGIPEDIFQLVIGGKDAGETLLDLPLDAYFFTGSYKTGKYIYEKVASKMVPCQLELGGKDPMYVTDDNNDVDKVAEIAAEGAFYNNGQSCCAVERIYVQENIYDDFIKAFLKEVRSYKMGDPTEEDTFIGPLSRKAQVAFMQDQVDDALSKGAELLLGGKKVKGAGYYYEPTIVVSTNHEMSVMMDESFGPVIGIQKVKDDKEAIELMKDTNYGLTSSVVTDNKERAENILKQMDSGTVYWNCCDRVSANLPWSGRKHSGIGSTLSYHGIRAFVKPKAYHLMKNEKL